jgi:hypothetical protein
MDHVLFPLVLLSGPHDAPPTVGCPFAPGDTARSRGASAGDSASSETLPPVTTPAARPFHAFLS